MEQMERTHFNEQIRQRTLNMAANVRNLLKSKQINAIDRVFVMQLIRCSSSVAANYRSATRGRSDAEFFSKICIVVEEADETRFWLEFLLKIEVFTESEISILLDETEQLTRLFSSIKKKMKEKLEEKKGQRPMSQM